MEKEKQGGILYSSEKYVWQVSATSFPYLTLLLRGGSRFWRFNSSWTMYSPNHGVVSWSAQGWPFSYPNCDIIYLSGCTQKVLRKGSREKSTMFVRLDAISRWAKRRVINELDWVSKEVVIVHQGSPGQTTRHCIAYLSPHSDNHQ